MKVTSSYLEVLLVKLIKEEFFLLGMYFDTKPKSERKDLFGMNYPLQILTRALADDMARLVVIKGLRRIGKTSLLNIALRECSDITIKIDVRESPFYDRSAFFSYLFRRVQERMEPSLLERAIQKIGGIGISYKEVGVEVFFAKEENVESFFRHLDQQLLQKKKKLVLAFDEAQLLKAIRFDFFLASVFDNYGQIKVVLTGSEIGLLDKFLGKQDYQSPLYGRALLEVVVTRFKEEEIKTFLEEGFRQLHKTISFDEVKEVIEQLDGIIGWATSYGWLRHQGQGHEAALERVREDGKEVVKRELQQFLERRRAKARYLKVLRTIAGGKNTWLEIKYTFQREKSPLTDSQLHLYLKELLDFGFLEKLNESYILTDPILLKTIKSLAELR